MCHAVQVKVDQGFDPSISAPVGHSNQQDVVQSIHTINLGQQLVDNGVMSASTVPDTAALPANGIYFIKDDDVQLLQAQVQEQCSTSISTSNGKVLYLQQHILASATDTKAGICTTNRNTLLPNASTAPC